MALSDNAMVRKQSDAAVKYAKRLLAAANARAKEEGSARTNGFLARGYWIAGVIEGERNDYRAADRDLRAALPLIQGNDAMLGATLRYLGVANYQIGRLTLNCYQLAEAARFSERAAAIKTSYSEQAWINAHVMKEELSKWR